jgi:uncharacterized protein (TIGR00730 family)
MALRKVVAIAAARRGGPNPVAKMVLGLFCGSSSGRDPAFAAAAQHVGTLLAQEGIGIVYGGGRVGLMGILADAALAAGGEVTGVITRTLYDHELGHPGLPDLHIVGTMHERKALMAELADGFLALPGGPGTLDEILEQWTWALLGIHRKPCAFLNVNGYYDAFSAVAGNMIREEFLDVRFSDMLIFSPDITGILKDLQRYSSPTPKFSPFGGEI